MRILCALFVLVAAALACECIQSSRTGPSATAGALFPFEQGDRIGFINARGKVVIRPALSASAVRLNTFDSGRLQLEDRDNVVFLDTRGREAIRRSDLEQAHEFQDGRAAVLDRQTNRWGFLAPDGSFAIPPRFHDGEDTNIGFFSEGLAAVQVDGKVGYIDKAGNWVIERQFAKGYEFHEGYAVVVTGGPCHYVPAEACCRFIDFAPYSRRAHPGRTPPCAFALIDRSGRQTTSRTFAYLRRLSEGTAAFLEGNKWGYINTDGEIVIPASFDDAEPFSEGRALVRIGDRYGFFDRRGTMVIPAKYAAAGSFSSGLAPVDNVSGAGWDGYIDRNGNVAIREEFDHAEEFQSGLALVRLLPKDHKFGDARVSVVPYDEYERWAYIDRFGKHVFEFSR
jgi:hypothetical protein